MSTAIAMAPSPAPHDRPLHADVPPSSSPVPRASQTPITSAPRVDSRSPIERQSTSVHKSSPATSRTSAPKIFVKKEPLASPELPSSRHRPRKLDLTKNTVSANAARHAVGNGPLTGDRGAPSSGLGIQDVGLACLSPGFVTQDPTMRHQLERSISVREQQRQLIESRLQQSAKPGDAPVESLPKDREAPATKTPQTSMRRKPPPGLSIVAPSHEQFAHERVIQSAPLNQTFTGRHQPQPLTRHVANHPANLAKTSHIHHVPATQTANRLPPISDVFAAEQLGVHRDREAAASRTAMLTSSTTPSRAGYPSPRNAPSSATRSKDFRSAEDAQAELSGGRPELLPKLVHYGGSHPTSPPSPGAATRHESRSNGKVNGLPSGRRRGRAEYEDGDSPPLGVGPAPTRRSAPGGMGMNAGGPFGEGRDSPRSQAAKRDEFMALCARAWDLFHS